MSLTKNQIGRYSRHLIMPEVGVNGQEKLAEAKVLCIGAGGLGSPLALYLASAGIGTLGIVDDGVRGHGPSYGTQHGHHHERRRHRPCR